MSGGNYKPQYSPRFKVTVDGTKYQEPGGRIADLVVETTLDGADRFSFALNYPFDPEHQDFSGMDWKTFDTGKSVSISMGYGGDGTLTDMFVGTIHSVQAEYTDEYGPTASVSGYGLLHELMVGTKSRSWAKTKVESVVKDVLKDYSFSTVDVDSSGLKRKKVIQHQENDYRFLSRLAQKYGYEFYAERDKVHFTERSSRGSESPSATLWYGAELDNFSAEINESNVVKEVEVRHWDMNNEKEIVGSAKEGTGGEKEVFRIPTRSKKEAEKIAKSKLSRLSSAPARGHGEADGLPKLKAGETIKLKEMGDRFSKKYYVTEATHRMGSSGYRTDFEVTEIPK